MKVDENSARVSFPPPLVYLGFLLLGFLIDRVAGLAGLPAPRSLLILLGAAAVGLGTALILAAIGRFRHAGTAPEPWREVTAFVSTGVYRLTRNPMYLGMAAMMLGIALACNSLAVVLLVPVAVLAISTQVIAREERYMAAKFGQPYADYLIRVRRWL